MGAFVIAQVGGDRLVASPLPTGSFLVRVHPDEGSQYDRMIVVSQHDEGRTLYLAGWIGQPLTPQQWRQAAAAMFPRAEMVEFDRLRPDGTFHLARLPLR